jgi:hypothetical protein
MRLVFAGRFLARVFAGDGSRRARGLSVHPLHGALQGERRRHRRLQGAKVRSTQREVVIDGTDRWVINVKRVGLDA